MKSATLFVLLSTLFFSPATLSEEVIRYETLPATYDSTSFGGFALDTWTFHCPAGGSVRIKVDVSATPGKTTSNLFPVIVLQNETENSGLVKDDVACSVPLDCGSNQCVDRTLDCQSGGEYLLNINNGSIAPCGEKEGHYKLGVEVFDGPQGTGAALPAKQVQLGGQKIVTVVAGDRYPAGPLRDDVYGFRNPDPVAPGFAAPGEANGESQTNDGLEHNYGMPANY